jgi:hypothetical protein
MKKQTIAVIGGSQELTFKKIGKKHGVDVLHHNGKVRNGGNAKVFRALIKKSDCIVVCLDACGHVSMDIVKDLAKKMDKKIDYISGFGATGAIQAGMNLLIGNKGLAA